MESNYIKKRIDRAADMCKSMEAATTAWTKGDAGAARMTTAEWTALKNQACRLAQACTEQSAATPMPTAFMSTMTVNDLAAFDPRQPQAAERGGELVISPYKSDLRPSSYS